MQNNNDSQNTPAPDSSDLDVVVGCISRYQFRSIAAWANSLESCGFRGRRVVIHLDVDARTVSELERRGYETYNASILHSVPNSALKKPVDPSEISVNRFYYIWHFLSRWKAGLRPPRYLIATDVRDVIFQRNPSIWLEQNLDEKRFVVGCESIRFEDEPWGAKTFQDSYGPDIWRAHQRNLIYNAGIIAGQFHNMIDLCLQIYLMSPGHRVHYSDQMALNVLLASRLYNEVTYFASLDESWACHVGSLANPDVLKKADANLPYPRPVFDGSVVRTIHGDVFTFVHQYDRVAEWANQLANRYSGIEAVDPATDKKPSLVSRVLNRIRNG